MKKMNKLIVCMLVAALAFVSSFGGLKVLADTEYAITVNGQAYDSVAAGKSITITADQPEEGKGFVGWSSDDIDLENSDEYTITFTMPDKPVNLTATYKDIYINTYFWDEVYTGKPFEPTISIFEVGMDGVDLLCLLTREYKNNINAGTANVTVTLNMYDKDAPDNKGRFIGLKKATFQIKPANISTVQAEVIDCTDTTGGLKPILNVKFNDMSLEEGKDFDVSCTYDANSGDAAYTLTGKGNFTGELKGAFKLHKITLNLDGGKVGGETTQEISVLNGKLLSQPQTPTKEGYTFDGWYMDENFTNKFDFSGDITANTIAYAKWNEIVEYNVIQETDKQQWQKGSTEPLKITFKSTYFDNETFKRFMGAVVDTKELKEGADFEKAEGSLIISLKPEYLNTLADGSHSLSVAFNDGGYADATFEIVAAPVQPVEAAPKTGDSNAMGLFLALAVLSIGGVVVVSKTAKEQTSR